MTYDGTNLTLYVNGSVDGSLAASGTIVTSSNPLWIGGDPEGPWALNGLVDEVSFYNRALTASEVQSVYVAGGAGKCVQQVSPAIVQGPTNQSTTVGGSASFAVTAVGTAPLAYQWYFNGSSALAGATGSSLTLSNAQLANAGTYSVTVNNAYGTATSSSATLTVSSSACDPAPAGLVGWWKAENNANDSIGSNNGFPVNVPTVGPGEVGQAFVFNGVNQYVEIPDAPALNPTNAITLEAWINFASFGTSGAVNFIAKDDPYGADRQYLFTTVTVSGLTYLRPAVGVPSGLQFFQGAVVLHTNTWYHVAMTYDGATLKQYINGVQDGSLPITGPIVPTANSLRLGGQAVGPWDFNGKLDEVSLYNRALTVSEIQAIYNAGSMGKCVPQVAPSIVQGPANQTTTVGGSAGFAVTAAGTAPLAYQWYFNGSSALAGATGSSLTLNNVQLANAGSYSVTVSNAYGTATSSGAMLTVLPPNSCDPAPTGLVGWWKAEGNANDSVGANNGTMIGGATFAAGEVGQAFSFTGNATSGVTQVMQVSDAPALNPANAITMECWVKMTAFGSPGESTTVIEKGGASDAVRQYSIAVKPVGAQHYFQGAIWTSAGYQGPVGVTPIVLNTWYHVATTYDGATVKVYVNGNLEVTAPQTGTIPVSTHPLWIAGDLEQPYNTAGLIDEVSLYNRALTATEVQTIYNVGSAGKCPLPTCDPAPVGLVGWWPLNGNWADVVGGDTGIPAGPTNFVAGEVGQAMSFNSVSNYVRIPATGNLNVGTQPGLTVEMWINPSDLADEQSLLEWNNGVTFGNHLTISTPGRGSGPGSVWGTLSDTNGNYYYLPSPAGLLVSNVFQHVAWTYDVASGNSFVYLNGNVIAQTNFGPIITRTTSDIYLGYRPAGPDAGLNFRGAMDEVSIYDRALTAAEIQAIYHSANAGKCVNPTAPQIVSQPVGLTVPAGAGAAFSVVAQGTSPLSYQWDYNGVNISGATGSTLSLLNVQNANAGNYSVIVSNAYGFTVSSNAILTVLPPVPTCDPAPSGLVGWWPLNGDWSDIIGGDTGTPSGPTNFVVGEVSQAMEFNGANNSVFIPASSNLNVGTKSGFTVEMWINPTSLANEQSLLEWNDGVIFGNHMTISTPGRGSGAGSVWGTLNDTNGNYYYLPSPAGLLASNVYQHVAWTYDVASGVSLIYLNAHVIASTNFGSIITRTTPAIYLGYRPAGPASGLRYNGAMDEVSVYNRALSATEISGIYNSSSAGKCPPPTCDPAPSALVGWWPLNGNWSDIIGGDTGTPSGPTNFVVGEVNQAMEFNGTNNSVFIPASSNLNVGTKSGFTVEMWINPTSLANEQSLLEWNDGVIFGNHMTISTPGRGSGAGSVWGTLNDTNGNYYYLPSPAGLLASNVYQHVAWTYDVASGVSLIYLNAHVIASTNFGSIITRTTPAIYLGYRPAGPASGLRYNGAMDEVSVYNRALSATEISGIYNAANLGKCIPSGPPMIVNQPANLTLPAGATAAFNVSAIGTMPLGYQWHFNGGNIAGATSSQLVVSNALLANGGLYSVTVSNVYGIAVSSNALLTVTLPPSLVQIVSVTATSGIVTVPINLVSQGDENALGFSVNFDSTLLSFANVGLGSGVPGGSLTANANLVSQGKLGLAVSLPTGAAFTAGTQNVANVSFFVTALSSNRTTSVSFGDQPVLRQVADPLANILAANYTNGTVGIPAVTNPNMGVEGDVTPLPLGDNAVTIADWVQEGRFVAGLDVIPTPGVFQRADCAPRSTLGDGLLTVADWVQVGRYATGLDPLTPAGGPSVHADISAPSGGVGTMDLGSRKLVVVPPASVVAGQTVQVSIQLVGQGNENAVGFSLNYDPAVLTFVGANPGADASASQFNVNPFTATNGTLGVALAQPIGAAFNAGTQEVALVTFNVAAAAINPTSIGFGSLPVVAQIVDPGANSLTTTYLAGLLNITPNLTRPVLQLTLTPDNTTVTLSWPATATGFNLESSLDLTPGSWSSVNTTPVTNSTTISVTLPLNAAQQFYRLHQP